MKKIISFNREIPFAKPNKVRNFAENKKHMKAEEKAKAYDRAIERAEGLIDFCSDSELKTLEYVFPELAESEDEKIRKEILNYIDKATGCKRWVAWLEKQGEPIDEEKVLIGARRDVALSIMKFLDRCTLGMCLSGMERADLESAVLYSDWSKVYDYMKKKLEKQCEKPQGKSALDAINEENVDNQNCVKPSVKGEPKFKVGDYVVDNCGYVRRIEGIINQFYILEGIDGGESRPTIEWVNKTFHLWDITEDAKNGDVLASKDEKDILIFRRIEPSTSFSSYYNIKGRGNYGWCDSYFIPATKEQRDKLEKSMADAGYTFDFEKKKLKKLKFKVGDEVITENEKSLTITKIDEKGYWSDDLFICNFDSECNWNLVEQKPADEVEQKFKVGDWVIDKQGIVHQVANVVENVTNHTYGYDIVGGGYFNDNAEGVRLWNISDAKDGDVLVNGSNTFIFHFINDTRLMGYCHVNTNDGRFYDDIGKNECFCLIDAVVNPATKEQCDVLFAKMKESGYEWNDDKKELKKIEQKPTWSEDEEDAIIKGELPVVAASGAFHSFKDRINWKPSEEQIYWLKWAIGRMTNTEKGNDAEAVLKDLLEQLENLLSTTPKLKT